MLFVISLCVMCQFSMLKPAPVLVTAVNKLQTRAAAKNKLIEELDEENEWPEELPKLVAISKKRKIEDSGVLTPRTRRLLPVVEVPVLNNRHGVFMLRDLEPEEDMAWSNENIYNIRNSIMEKISGRKDVQLVELDEQEKYIMFLNGRQLYGFLERTISYGESNSALLLGPKGSGKSAVLVL